MNGRVETNPLAWIELAHEQIVILGKEAKARGRLTLALHKPKNVLTTRRDELGRTTVYDLLPHDLPWVFPVGRLDADSEGLLILTNDSHIAMTMSDPIYHVPKRYQITLVGLPSQASLEQLRKGVNLSDGPARPAIATFVRQNGNTSIVEMVLTEGRNRQARRMWAAVGHRVLRLVRVAIGAFTLGDLPAGAHRIISAAEIELLTQRAPTQTH